MITFNQICPQCGEPLSLSNFPRHYAILCLNWQCHLHRQVQGTIRKLEEPKPHIVKPYKPKTLLPGYQNYLRIRRFRYQQARNLGIPATEAKYYTTKKGFDRIKDELCAKGVEIPA